jgi:alkylhydroperoxidase/carboxymuconolactone decarboxylase family protein YurZ
MTGSVKCECPGGGLGRLDVAIDASTTHLYNPGTRIHIANALKQGATRDEVMEVLEIVSVLGIHTITEGVAALLDEVKKAGRA